MYELNALNAFLSADTDAELDDWGQFSTLETPPQPQQFKARVKPVLPRIQEEEQEKEKEKPSLWGTFIDRNITTLEKFLDWLS
jgi:hypothetical protein